MRPANLRAPGPADPTPARPIYLDPERLQAHSLRNHTHSALLVIALVLIMGFSAWLLWGPLGIVAAAIGAGLIVFLGPRLPPETVMRLYRAQRVTAEEAPQLAAIVSGLAERAQLPAPPQIYVVPSVTLNAFAVGNERRSAVAMTEGIIRALTLRELQGVLGHELSHIKNGDLWIMGLADGMHRLTRALSYAAILLLLFHLPSIFSGTVEVPWLAVLLLLLAPMLASLLQLGLSRAREYEADLDSAMLTGDPEGLASALSKLEDYHGGVVEDIAHPSRRIPHPSVLRSHPSTADRIARLKSIAAGPLWKPPLVPTEQPMMTALAGLGPGAMRPRYHWTGVWY